MHHSVRFIAVLCVLAVAILIAFPGGALSGQSVSPAEDPAQFGQGRTVTQDESLTKLTKEQEKQRNKERHEALKKDTDKLLELATELKLYVDKSNENMLSLNVVRKADEIEKLAHNVRQKMKGN